MTYLCKTRRITICLINNIMQQLYNTVLKTIVIKIVKVLEYNILQ